LFAGTWAPWSIQIFGTNSLLLSRACGHLRFRWLETATGPTISSRTRSCAHGDICIAFRTAPISRLGSSRSCANHFYSEHRKRQREVEDVDGFYAASLISVPDQNARLDLQDFQRALMQLPVDQREALLLVGAQGFSYEEAAVICGCAMGTIKSRISRARVRLAELLALNEVDDLGPDSIVMAALHPDPVA
jgi:predicted DNA-binding protein (UPF0251 family)